MQRFAKIYEKSFIENWELPALTEYTTRRQLRYGDLAREIAMLHLLFETIGEPRRARRWRSADAIR